MTGPRNSQPGRRLSRRAALLIAVAIVAVGGAAGVLAYYLASGTASASGSVGTLNPPTNVVAKAANGSTSLGAAPVTITWTAPLSGATPTSYQVVRDDGTTPVTLSGCGLSSCTDSGVANGTYTYHISSRYGTSWTSTTADSNSIQVQNQASPTLSLSVPATGTTGTAIAASSISAAFGASSGANAGGTITFFYYQQASAPSTCGTSGRTTIGTATVSGNSTYNPSAGFTPTVAGNYWLYASYGGDGNNNAANSACPPGTSQEIVVAKASPTLTLTQSSSPSAGSGTTGTAIAASSISAAFGASSGANAGGTITFYYYQQASAPSTCGTSGRTTIGTATVSGNSTYNPSAGFTPTVAGNYWLYASYGGDSNNNPANSACPPGTSQKIVVAAASPTLTLAQSSSPSAGSGTAGTAIAASSISAAFGASSGANAGGTITFFYYQQASAPSTCGTSGRTTIGTATVSGNSTYNPSAGFTPTVAGNYWLYASYGGDGNNNPANSACPPGTSQEIVVAKAQPSVSSAVSGAPGSGTAGTLFPAASISATVTGRVTQDGSGTVSFFYLQQASAPTVCSGGTQIGSAVTEVAGNTYNPSAGFTPTVAGNYWVYAVYSGDGNNLTASGTCAAGNSQKIVVAKAQPSVSSAVSGAPGSGTAGTLFPAASISATVTGRVTQDGSGTVSFFYLQQASAPTVCSGGTQIGSAVTEVAGNTYNPSAGFTPTVAGNYWVYAVYSGDGNNLTASGTCAAGNSQKIVVAKAQPSVSSAVSGAPGSGTAGTLFPAASISATVTGRVTQDGSGTVSFFYLQQASAPTVCSGGTQIGSAVTEVAGNTYNPSAGFTPTVAGNYWVYAVYSGDGNNLTASGTCAATGSQEIVVSPGTATKLVFTQQPTNVASGGSITPAVTVAVEDANGNVVTTDNSTKVTLAIGTNPGSGTLTGGGQVQVNNGVATYSAASIDKTGIGYTLTATDTTGAGGGHPYTAATSSPFNVTPGTATKLVFTQQPTNSTIGNPITPSVTVSVEDANGNVVTTDNSTKITLAIGTNPSGGTLTGGGQVTVTNGVTTYASASLNNVGTGYTLTATDATGAGGGHPYTGATSNTFNETALFGAGIHTLTVPAGVTTVHFTLLGAGGGGNGTGKGGDGGSMTNGTITLSSNPSGVSLTVVVGAGGGTSTTGGASGAGCFAGGGGGSGTVGGAGGGASCIYVTGSSGNPIAVVGAGGGGGDNAGGAGSGGNAGGAGSPTTGTPTGGGGGTTSPLQGGAAGLAGSSGNAGIAGGTFSSGTGGAGGAGPSTGNENDGGGGGGGGYASGGGGGTVKNSKTSGGGGGGSGFNVGTTGVTVSTITYKVTAVTAAQGGGGAGSTGTGGDGSATFSW